MLIGQLRGGILEFFGQTGKLLFVCRAGPIAAVGIAAAEQRTEPVGDGDDVLGVSVRVLAVAEECDALKAHVGNAGTDDIALLVLLHAKAQVGVFPLALRHVLQGVPFFFLLVVVRDVDHLAVLGPVGDGFGGVCRLGPGGVKRLGCLSIGAQLDHRRLLGVHGDAAVAELAVIALALPFEGDVQAVRPGKDKVLAVPAVHALDDACGQGPHGLAQRHGAGADGVALALQDHGEGGVAGAVVHILHHGFQRAPRDLVLMLDGIAHIVLAVGPQEGAAELEGLGRGGGILGEGVELPLGLHGLLSLVLSVA